MSQEKNLAILNEIRRMARRLPIGMGNEIINKCNKAQVQMNRRGEPVVDEGPGGQPHFESQAKAVLAGTNACPAAGCTTRSGWASPRLSDTS